MQQKDINELKQQALLLGKFLRTTHGTELPHSALLEAMAAMHNAPDWNALQARKPTRPSAAPQDLTSAQLLELAADKGLNFGEAINFFAERQSPHEKAYAEYARENLARDGELEFDDPGCIVSLSEKGAYVSSWSWVYATSIASRENPPDRVEHLTGFDLNLMGLYKDGVAVDAAFAARFDYLKSGEEGEWAECLVVIDAAGKDLFSVPLESTAQVVPHKLDEKDEEYVEDCEPADDAILVAVKSESWEIRLELSAQD